MNDLLAASIKYTPMTDIPFLTDWATGDATAIAIINKLFMLSITLGAMLAVFMFIWGGLQMIIATDQASAITKGKEKMKNAILGLLMLLSTYLVLSAINPQITNLEFTGSDFKLKAQENRGLIEYDALYKDNPKQMDILCSGLKNDGRRVANIQKVKDECKKWNDKKVDKIKELEKRLKGDELRYCSKSWGGGCYVKGDNCPGKSCPLKKVSKTEPVKDGRYYLSPGGRKEAYGRGSAPLRYNSMDACNLAKLKVAGSSGSNFKCIE